MPPRTVVTAPTTNKMRRAQVQKLKVVKLEVIQAAMLITADLDAETRAELASSMDSSAQKLAGVARFLRQDGTKS